MDSDQNRVPNLKHNTPMESDDIIYQSRAGAVTTQDIDVMQCMDIYQEGGSVPAHTITCGYGRNWEERRRLESLSSYIFRRAHNTAGTVASGIR
jgi:hypothetical protein